MRLKHILPLLLSFWALTSPAADTSSVNPAQTSVSGTNQPAQNGTNDIIELPVSGRFYTNSIGMVLIPVPGEFWAGEYEVTQKEYQKVMGMNPSAFGGGQRPVDSVSWNNAMDFCQRLTQGELQKKYLTNNFHYCLPTEAEWQGLVGNAGLDSAVTSLGGTRRTETSQVGSLAPNSLGLYDVRGNVMEFCLSDDKQAFRFLKGGSWKDFVDVNLRPEFRWYCKPDETLNSFGFRVLLKGD